MPAGRPSTYDPAYCEQVMEFMALGYSLTAFAGSIRKAWSTVHIWMAEHPEFSDAVKVGKAARTFSLERDLLSEDVGPRITARIFALKNAAPEEWRDKHDHTLAGADGGPVQNNLVVTFVKSGKQEYALPPE